MLGISIMPDSLPWAKNQFCLPKKSIVHFDKCSTELTPKSQSILQRVVEWVETTSSDLPNS